MKVYIVLRCFDYEGSQVLSAWTTKEAADKERDKLDDPDERVSYLTYEVREIEVQS